MKEKIEAVMENIKESGNFFAKTTIPQKNIKVEVAGIGELKFPLSVRKINQLIKLARPAKFGKGEKTLYDKNVRDVWEIKKNKLSIKMEEAPLDFADGLDKIAAKMGISKGAKFKAKLHNLLIYEPGQFFCPHQDSEKLDKMVATLVVVLPQGYKGGTLVVEHLGKKENLRAPTNAAGNILLAGFYADCLHHITPLKYEYESA